MIIFASSFFKTGEMRTNRIKYLLPVIIAFGLCFQSMGQESAEKGHLMHDLQQAKPGEGTITIRQDAGVDEMMRDHRAANQRMAVIEGYRIQLYSGSGVNSKREAMAVKIKFLGLFPDEPVDLFYNAPFWRVRVGSYRFKNEALPLLTRVKRHFPNSYMVKDNQVRKNDVK